VPQTGFPIFAVDRFLDPLEVVVKFMSDSIVSAVMAGEFLGNF